jgi:CSLREA domain-containing protein
LRGGTALAKFVLALACVAVVVGAATRETAEASHCIITPALGDVTVNRGLPYARLVRGKETMVKLYLRMPSPLPSCAGAKSAIKIVDGTLTVKNGTTQIGPSVRLLPDAINALITSSSIMQNQPADPKFIVLGSNLPPSAAGIQGSFTATFSITINYQSKGSTTDAFTTTQSVPFTTSKVVEGPTKAIRILAVPMAAALTSTQAGTLTSALTALSGMYPVQDLSGSGLARVGVLPTTTGGIRYALNNAGFVNVGATPFCGTSTNYAGIQTQLQAFMTAYNDANTTDNDVDRTVGVIADTLSTPSGTSANCFEGFTITNTQQTWVRLVPDAPGAPSTTGSLLAMETCHTFSCTTSSTTLHSYFTNADNLAENVNRAFNPLTWSWLSDDRSAMRYSAPGWNNSTTVLEKGDFGYLLCGLGGANTSGCPGATAGTLTGVAAGPTFELDGTTDGLGEASTAIGNSHKSTVAPQTTADPASTYRFLQKAAPSPSATVLSNLGVPVRAVHSGHGTDQDVGAGNPKAFSFAFPLNAATQRIELRNGLTLLWARNLTAAPTVTSVSVSSGGGVESPIPGLHASKAKDHSAAHSPAAKRVSAPRRAARLARAELVAPALSWSALSLAVNSTGDGPDTNLADGVCNDGSDNCTLRAAIMQANATSGADTIDFGIGSGSVSLQPSSAYPQITEALTIDGWTQGGAGYTGPPLVELNGTATGGDALAASAPLVARGLVINRFPGSGIALFAGSGGSVVQGNYLGTDASGNAAQGNGGAGVHISSTGNTIGGAGDPDRNVISANDTGIALLANSNTVTGNYIGTNAGGTAALGNASNGIALQAASSNTITNNVISGTRPTAAAGAGIDLTQSATQSNNNIIQGNFIGTDKTGAAALPNSRRGISLNGASNNTIGGSAAGQANVISGNTGDGIDIPQGTENVIRGNRIGVAANGTSPLGNGAFGIQMSTSNNTIGGLTAAEGNVIANNGSAGLVMTDGSGNNIIANRFYANGSLGINLGNDLVTENDAGDTDTGPNNRQNFPVLTSATLGGGTLTVSGTLDTNSGLSNTAFRIEVFLNSVCDGSGNGEGEFFVGASATNVDGSGHASFTFAFPTSATGGFATATAMAAGTGDTSEFSDCLTVTEGGGDSPQTGPTFTVNIADDHADPGGCTVNDCSLREAIDAANAHPNGVGRDQIVFAITGSGPQQIAIQEVELPGITEAVGIDGETERSIASGVPAASKAIVLNGTGAGATADGLTLATGGSEVKGLAIGDFSASQVVLDGTGVSGNVVKDDYIGAAANGTTEANNGTGITIRNGAHDNTVGGDKTVGNVILGHAGVEVAAGAGTGNVIAGNNIGLDAAGAAHVATALPGIHVSGSGTIIGDNVSPPGFADPDKGNVIVGRRGAAAIFVESANSTKVTGNFLGTNRSGATEMGNTDGIQLTGGGGNTLGPGNTIAFNTGIGVSVASATNRIVANSIHDNGGLGIDVDPDFVTIDPPTLTSATGTESGATVNGTFVGTPNSQFFIEFFKNSACDPSGAGEGETYIGFVTATTDGSGNASYGFSSTEAGLDDVMTATASTVSATPTTSEFSGCVTVVSGGTPEPGPVDVGADATDDFPADARATFYWDCGGIKYPIKVGVPPTSFDANAHTAHFEVQTNTTPNCASEPGLSSLSAAQTTGGVGTVSVLVDDGFTQTGFSDVARAVVQADNQPPVVSFAAPAPAPSSAPGSSVQPRPGEFLEFESILVRLAAMDPEDNALTGDSLTLTTTIPGAGGPFHGERILLSPPPGTGWTPGTYDLTATADDGDGHTATRTITIRILADADHDGLSANFEQGCLSDDDPFTPGQDTDSDGIPNGNELTTAGGPCTAETTYGAIIDFDPDDLQRTSSGTPVSVKVKVPFRSVSQIVPSSVKITKITYVDASGHFAEATLNQPTVSWSASGAEALAKFDRQRFINALNQRGIKNQPITVEVGGAFTDGKQWSGTDRTNVK